MTLRSHRIVFHKKNQQIPLGYCPVYMNGTMGVHTQIYIGPYVEGTYRRVKQLKAVRACLNSQCPNNSVVAHLSDKFCANCSTKIDTHDMEVDYTPSMYDVLEDYEDSLTQLNNDYKHKFYMGANQAGPRQFHVGSDARHHESLVGVSPEREMDWFRTSYTEELRLIRENFNDVEVGWGLHVYLM